MAGSAILGSNLIDELVPIIDECRETLHADFGYRQYRVYLVRRRWSGTRRGEGTLSAISSTELVPSPRVEWRPLKTDLTEIGLDEDGPIVITEVSLTYTEAELTGQTIAATDEFFYGFTETAGLGQSIRDRTFVPSSRPLIADREKNMGWQVELVKSDAPALPAWH